MEKESQKTDIQKWMSKADAAELKRLNFEYEFIKIAVTQKGFTHLYFKELASKNHKTKKDAFNYLNEKYFDAVGEPRYITYNSFRGQLNKYLTNSDENPRI